MQKYTPCKYTPGLSRRIFARGVFLHMCKLTFTYMQLRSLCACPKNTPGCIFGHAHSERTRVYFLGMHTVNAIAYM